MKKSWELLFEEEEEEEEEKANTHTHSGFAHLLLFWHEIGADVNDRLFLAIPFFSAARVEIPQRKKAKIAANFLFLTPHFN